MRASHRFIGLLGQADDSLRRTGAAAIDGPSRWGPVARLARRIGWRLTRVQMGPVVDAQRAMIRALIEEHADAASDAAQLRQLIGNQESHLEPGADLTRVQAIIARFMNGTSAIDLVHGGDASVVEVSTDVGSLLMPEYDEAMLTYMRRDGTWEPSEGDAIEASLRPGMAALDLGAHVGYRTLLMANLVGPRGRVIAVEAEPSNYRLLAANLHRHAIDNTYMLQMAAGDRRETVQLALSRTNSGDNRLFAHAGEATIGVEMAPLDTILPGGIELDFIKCDLQGYEMRALRGMERTLLRCHPVVVVEFCPRDIRELGDDPMETLSYYQSLGYRLEVIGSETVCPPASPETVIEEASKAQHSYVNLRLVPEP
jgi:FkbM family methyltransferase